MIKFHLWKRRSKKKSSPCVITSGMSSFLARVVWMCVRLCSPALRTTLSCLCAPVPLYCLQVITHRHVHTCMFMCECVRFLSDNTISPSCCGESQDDQMTHIRHTHTKMLHTCMCFDLKLFTLHLSKLRNLNIVFNFSFTCSSEVLGIH